MDIDAYLARIGVDRGATLAEIHRAHVLSIPFENLDPFAGTAPSLDLEDLQDKLVTRRRGGYCFEQNLLLKGALEALGHTVEPLLARVTIGGIVRPRTHLVLRVDDVWHADVGFGIGGLLGRFPGVPASRTSSPAGYSRTTPTATGSSSSRVARASTRSTPSPSRTSTSRCPTGSPAPIRGRSS